jgi:hypothetical protein
LQKLAKQRQFDYVFYEFGIVFEEKFHSRYEIYETVTK